MLLASASAALAAPALISPSLAASVSTVLQSVGIVLLCIAAAAFLIAAIPTLWAMGRAAHRAEAVLRVVEEELPDTVAALRLSGLEITDCINELSGLGQDLSGGLRSTARLASMTEEGVKQSVAAADRVLVKKVVPALARTEVTARGSLEGALQERARLGYTLPVIRQVASATTTAVQRLRLGMVAATVAAQAVRAGRAARQRAVWIGQNMSNTAPLRSSSSGGGGGGGGSSNGVISVDAVAPRQLPMQPQQ